MFRNLLKSPIGAFFLCFSLTISAELNRRCPARESIPFCSCHVSVTGPVVSCTRVSSTLNEIISALKGYMIAELEITEVELKSLSPNAFQGLHIEDLSISELQVKEALNPEERYLQGLESSLKGLHISKSFNSKPLVDLRTDHLVHLEVIILEDSGIQKVTHNWFSGGPASLKTLIFERNLVKTVDDKAFASLKNLRTFALAGNSLTNLPRSALPQPANHLHTLDLAYNQIADIPEDFFVDMPSLRSVNLDHNVLTMISESVMSPVWNYLSELHIVGNPLSCSSEIKWICKYRRIALIGKCQHPSEAAGKDIIEVCQ